MNYKQKYIKYKEKYLSLAKRERDILTQGGSFKEKYLSLKDHTGGKKIGQGSHGTAYDVNCDTTNESLCYFIDTYGVNKITIYNTSTISYDIPIEKHNEFIKLLKDTTNKIAKIFTEKETFLSELEENIKINTIYGEKKHEYLTLDPIFKFNDHDIYSSIIEYKNNKQAFILYSTKCIGNIAHADMKIKLPKLIIDILESIVILQEHNYMHNDIKLDNIVYCNGKYKLIDWGASNDKNVDKRGSLLGTNPIRLYVLDYCKLCNIKNVIYIRSLMKIGSDYVNSILFGTINRDINIEVDIILSQNKDKKTLNEIYKNSYDIFMLGMTIVHAMHQLHYDIFLGDYIILIRKFVSLTNPVKDAKEALEIAIEHFTSRKINYK
jgi:serine/threonine protein kinase